MSNFCFHPLDFAYTKYHHTLILSRGKKSIIITNDYLIQCDLFLIVFRRKRVNFIITFRSNRRIMLTQQQKKLDIPSHFGLFILNLNFHDSSKFSR